MKTASAKAKGREHQKAIAKILTEKLGLEEGDLVSRSMGAAGTDILASPAAVRCLPVSIECKATKVFPSTGALEQSRANALPGTVPCVVWKPPRKNSSKSLIYFQVDEFGDLVNMIKKCLEK